MTETTNQQSIIETGGQQFLVVTGSVIRVPSVPSELGQTVQLTDLLTGKAVTATVVTHGRAKKIRVVRFHNKTRSYRRRGHRQDYTELRIASVK